MRICYAGKRASADLSPAICSPGALARIQLKSFLRGNFTLFPFNYFTHHGHGTGYYREDTSVNVIIITSDKKEYPHLWPERIPAESKKRLEKEPALSLSPCDGATPGT